MFHLAWLFISAALATGRAQKMVQSSVIIAVPRTVGKYYSDAAQAQLEQGSSSMDEYPFPDNDNESPSPLILDSRTSDLEYPEYSATAQLSPSSGPYSEVKSMSSGFPKYKDITEREGVPDMFGSNHRIIPAFVNINPFVTGKVLGVPISFSTNTSPQSPYRPIFPDGLRREADDSVILDTQTDPMNIPGAVITPMHIAPEVRHMPVYPDDARSAIGRDGDPISQDGTLNLPGTDNIPTHIAPGVRHSPVYPDGTRRDVGREENFVSQDGTLNLPRTINSPTHIAPGVRHRPVYPDGTRRDVGRDGNHMNQDDLPNLSEAVNTSAHVTSGVRNRPVAPIDTRREIWKERNSTNQGNALGLSGTVLIPPDATPGVRHAPISPDGTRSDTGRDGKPIRSDGIWTLTGTSGNNFFAFATGMTHIAPPGPPRPDIAIREPTSHGHSSSNEGKSRAPDSSFNFTSLKDEVPHPKSHHSSVRTDSYSCVATGSVCVPRCLCNKEDIISNRESLRHSECPMEGYVCCSAPLPVRPLDPIDPLSLKPHCGKRNYLGTSYGKEKLKANEAHFGEFPWTAALFAQIQSGQEVRLICGGSLVSPNAVLTAAYCLPGLQGEYFVRLGEWDLSSHMEPFSHQDIKVIHKIVYPDYNGSSSENSYVILILASPVELSENVGLVCLPSANQNFTFHECIVSGWGTDNGVQVQKQKKIVMNVMEFSECERIYQNLRGRNFKLHENIICAKNKGIGGTCSGDGGSPLVCPVVSGPGQETHYVQAGIVGWGSGCGPSSPPEAFYSLPKVVQWIEKVIQDFPVNRN